MKYYSEALDKLFDTIEKLREEELIQEQKEKEAEETYALKDKLIDLNSQLNDIEVEYADLKKKIEKEYKAKLDALNNAWEEVAGPIDEELTSVESKLSDYGVDIDDVYSDMAYCDCAKKECCSTSKPDSEVANELKNKLEKAYPGAKVDVEYKTSEKDGFKSIFSKYVIKK